MLLDTLHLFFRELVTRIVDPLVVADGLRWHSPLDPRLPGLAQARWVHSNLPTTTFLLRVFLDQVCNDISFTKALRQLAQPVTVSIFIIITIVLFFSEGFLKLHLGAQIIHSRAMVAFTMVTV